MDSPPGQGVQENVTTSSSPVNLNTIGVQNGHRHRKPGWFRSFVDRADAHAEPFGGLLLPHASRHRLDRLGPCLQWDDGFGHMAGIPGILCQPAFQALPPGLITQVLHHLGSGHRRDEIQVHRALSSLGTGHTIGLSFSLQENVRTLLQRQLMQYLHSAQEEHKAKLFSH